MKGMYDNKIGTNTEISGQRYDTLCFKLVHYVATGKTCTSEELEGCLG